MQVHYNLITKFFLFITLIVFSFYFFYFGYYEIKKNHIEINSKSNTYTSKNDIDKKDTPKKNNINTFVIQELGEAVKNEETNTEEIVIIVKKNDTFLKLIDPFIPNKKNKQKLTTLINNEYDLKSLKINQKILLYLNDNKLSKIVMPMNFNLDLVITIKDKDNFVINKEKLPIKNQFYSAKFEITESLYENGRKYGIPLTILSEVIKLYSFDVDFQRDIHKGNSLEILYESFFNEQRRTISYGKIYYAKLNLQKNNLEYFLFKTNDGFYDYFNSKGKNVKKTLMKTPIDGAKLSSSYGVRKHPILGYNKLHKGLDFAAPTGTPIYAAGNGVIEYIGRNGAYGKYIRIRHNSSYKTAYAHLNKFKKGIRKGIRVNQGETIGYVGTTGRSTGPHLHYEVIYQNKQINPKTMKLPSGKVLKNEELRKFIEQSKSIYSDFLYHLYE